MAFVAESAFADDENGRVGGALKKERSGNNEHRSIA